jgi:hypothetical protein
MSTVAEPPPPQAPDAGVIEEAHARQRRHRSAAVAAAIAIAAIVAIGLALTGGGGAIHQGRITWLAADGRVIKTFDPPE